MKAPVQNVGIGHAHDVPKVEGLAGILTTHLRRQGVVEPLRQHPLPRRAFAAKFGYLRSLSAYAWVGTTRERIDTGRLVQKTTLEYVDAGDLSHAVASMASGLKTHPDTDKPTLNGLALLWQIKSSERILTARRLGDLESRRDGRGRGS